MSFVTGYAEIRSEKGGWREAYPGPRKLFCLEVLTPTWEMMFGKQAIFSFHKGFPEDASRAMRDRWTGDGHYGWILVEDLLLESWESETLFVKMEKVPVEKMHAFADGSRIQTWDEVNHQLDLYQPTFYAQEAILHDPQELESIKHRKDAHARCGPVTWRMRLKDFVDPDLRIALFEDIQELAQEQEMRLIVVEEM